MTINQKHYPLELSSKLESIIKNNTILKEFKKSRIELSSDIDRPLYHFSPPQNSLNDPNGLCEWQGAYHLFYQFKGNNQNRVHWGHAISHDLISWIDLPPAISPEYEKDCFSGQSLVEADRVIAIYHGTESGNCIATSSDKLLINWEKNKNNPIIPIIETDDKGLPYRVFDPCIWKEKNEYYSISGTYKNGTRGVDAVGIDHLFKSSNLDDWKHIGSLFEDSFHAEPGEDAAVPNFLPISKDKYLLLLFSHKRASHYYIGTYDPIKHKFSPETHGRMNYGPWMSSSLHAASATIDSKGRCIAIFNTIEGKEQTQNSTKGIMTLPRHLYLKNNYLNIEPIEELKQLRFNEKKLKGFNIPANNQIDIKEIQGKSIEIELIINPKQAREVGINVLQSPNKEEYTKISFLKGNHTEGYPFENIIDSLQIDVSNSSLRKNVKARSPETGPLKLEKDEPLELRIFIDRSIVEVFANKKQCLTLRTYPAFKNSNRISIFSKGSDADLISLRSWSIKSIWSELKQFEGC
ncbi:MAG: glycoside hydrolase family 32 protein [SAR202 cluster bacterium]|nr:glycoside hydrolase family 32 protein [SAR202 cluster bacterium]|tara:strand:- start:26060 stop:27622 length:1563 start_codon:yes stop_codon:yes gene_type:complete